MQALDVVAGPVVVALLVELRGAHLAAAACVRNPADQWGTGGGCRRAGAHGRAAPLCLLMHGVKGHLRTGEVMRSQLVTIAILEIVGVNSYESENT